jgi:hypothetical protein
MNVIMPPPNAGMPAILDAIRRAFIPVVAKHEAVDHILLLSPNGTTYSVTVSNAGVLSTAVVDGKSRG